MDPDPNDTLDRDAMTLRTQSTDTKTRILDAAESLFTDVGYEAMSLRQITSAAKVNLASVNYHYGGKELLIQEVVRRRMDPLSTQRISLLESIQATRGSAMTCEDVLVAMFLPSMRMSRGGEPGGERYLRFLGRAYSDPSPVIREYVSQRYATFHARYFEAFAKTLPNLPRAELGFRLNFAMGALSGVLAGGSTNRLINEFTQGQADDELTVLSRLATLMVGALQAPVPSAAQMEGYRGLLAHTQAAMARAEGGGVVKPQGEAVRS